MKTGDLLRKILGEVNGLSDESLKPLIDLIELQAITIATLSGYADSMFEHGSFSLEKSREIKRGLVRVIGFNKALEKHLAHLKNCKPNEIYKKPEKGKVI